MPIRVLLADDHAVLREGLRLLLEDQGDITVVGEAFDGHDAWRQATQLRPDIVLMDIAMPGLSGIVVTDQILQSCPDTRVVILSMYSTREHVLQALQAGAQGYVLKASVGREVVDAIRAVQAGRRYLSQPVSEILAEEYLRLRQVAPTQSPLDLLSPREREILKLVAEGMSSTSIAELLGLSPKSVDTYRKRLMEKLDIHDVTGLVRFAIRHGVISLD